MDPFYYKQKTSNLLFLLCFFVDLDYVFVQKAVAGIKRINLDGLRWRVFDARGQVFFLLPLFQSTLSFFYHFLLLMLG